ncbi:E3 ubiquitin ligase BIG BROTHER [Glycine max]|nr:E3 ubiquitin ligase BIG BROTHER [Glycine max]|eukprot:XP_006592972.2 E3 ubiquitin-protein ligase BIG BROTHER isoform X1 [Glycine max]
MNDGRQMGVNYVDAGFPYAVNENFVDFFQGFTPVPVNYAFAGSIPDQESVYWSMNMNPYKFGLSGPGSTSYYSSYEVNGHLPRMEIDRAEWEYPSTITTVEEPATTDSPPRRDGVTNMQTIPEECSPNHHESNSSSQVIWQDNIDPDNMTYEVRCTYVLCVNADELLDLGEAVGTQSRGLSQELIDMLPTSKYKFGNLFKRKNSGKRCVICQMTYRRGDQQMKLPCSHVYHGECITKWLSINKKCPVCNTEVFGEESTH